MNTLYIVGHRGGAQDNQGDLKSVKENVEMLIQELETEEFEEPDNEHCEISILTIRVIKILFCELFF